MGVSKRRQPRRSERRISVRGLRRDPPDLHKLARALLALAQAEAEAQADAKRAKPESEGSDA